MIEIQQALFGYRDGHNLVASSVPLLTRERLLLAKVTDSSGPENLPGFESAITGLPIPDFGYALFCTWRAPEMPRPGCVWSHVLLIKFDDLGEVDDLSTLRTLFARPASLADFSSYTCGLAISPLSDAPSPPSTNADSTKKVQMLIHALYEHPEEDVVILDETSAGWDETIFAVWSQQWKSLRRAFSFSTASLGDRRVGGVQCTVQVMPAAKGRAWRKSPSPTFVCEPYTTRADAQHWKRAEWKGAALADLALHHSKFRSFLEIFAADVPPARSLFPPLCDIYHRFEVKGPERRGLLQFVGRVFPERSHGAILKDNLLTGPQMNCGFENQVLLENLDFIISCDESKAYDTSGFDFKTPVSILWEHARKELIGLLSRQLAAEPSEPLSQVFRAVSLNVDTRILQELAQSSPILIPTLVRYNWKLAAEVETWCFNLEIQSKVFEVLTGLSLEPSEWALVMGAMFVAATPVCIRESIERSGSQVMLGIYQWLDRPISEQMLPSSLWRSALSNKAEELVARGDCDGPAQFALAAWLVAPWRIVKVPGLDQYVDFHFRSGAIAKVPRPLRLATSFLLLTVALRSGGKGHLIAQSFFSVHESLASGGYDHETWDIIAPYLPDLGWWKSWDRCERLRRALNHYYHAHPNERESLINSASTAAERELAQLVTK